MFKPNFSPLGEPLSKSHQLRLTSAKRKGIKDVSFFTSSPSFLLTSAKNLVGQLSSLWTPLNTIATFSLANCYGVVSGLHHDSTPIIASLLFLVTCPLAVTLVRRYRHHKHQWRLNLFTTGVISFLMANFLSSPAQALFFENAEDFFNKSFTSSTAATGIVFNALRGIYILYIAVSLIGVINSVRQDEDWLATAKMPAIVVVSVTLSDILTDVIIS